MNKDSIQDVGMQVKDGLFVTEISPMSVVIDHQYSYDYVVLRLLLSLGVASLLMVGGGLYGVISYAISLRKKEMAIRMALGATPTQIVLMCIWDGLKSVFWGVGIGVLGGFSLHVVLKDLVRPYYPDLLGLSFLLGTLLLLTLIAIIIPTWRASRIEPMDVLRSE